MAVEDCHICGSEAVTRAVVEGATVFLCGGCTYYGRPVRDRPRPSPGPFSSAVRPSAPMPELGVVDGFGRAIREAREKLGLSREELARKLFIRENVLSRLEEGKLKPQRKTAEKLEKALNIKLVVREKTGKDENETAEGLKKMQFDRREGRELTLADVIDIKVKD